MMTAKYVSYIMYIYILCLYIWVYIVYCICMIITYISICNICIYTYIVVNISISIMHVLQRYVWAVTLTEGCTDWLKLHAPGHRFW